MAFSPGGAGAKGAVPVLNVTPLVDVTLVVLIIFMVVAPMLTKTFTLVLPSESLAAAPSEPLSDEPMVLALDAHGALTLNKRPIAVAELGEALPPLVRRSRQKVLSVEAADELAYGDVLAVVDAARAAGAPSVAMVTRKHGP